MIATHGVFMLLGWLFLAPWGVFIVRYLKTRTWHLVAHISIMGFVGSVRDNANMSIDFFVGGIISQFFCFTDDGR
jgi:hypothetical protein